MINEGIVNVSYIIATILFILALGGLSNQETARRGNWYGIIGMAIALLATIFGEVSAQYDKLIVALLVGGSVGLILARRVQMTQMPELVAILHSLVGLAAGEPPPVPKPPAITARNLRFIARHMM
jgi:NAD(P) transhydrogenase subunit beta